MTEKKFEELWVQIRNTALDIVNECNDGTSFNNKKRNSVEYEYNRLREICKKKHMRSEPDSPRLDRHKVASCIAGAILRVNPLEYYPSKGYCDRIKLSFLANEALSLFSALAIVKSFIRSDVTNEIKLPTEYKEIFLKNGFLFPEPRYDEYIPWLLYLLQDSSTVEFNVLSFSNILFLIETYTFSIIELEITKKDLDIAKYSLELASNERALINVELEGTKKELEKTKKELEEVKKQ